MRFWVLRERSHPWGGFLQVLADGLVRDARTADGLLQIERAGPFVPPVTFPRFTNIVVPAATRVMLERSGLDGVNYQPVVKPHVVTIHWEQWDINAGAPDYYPESGEPSDYVQTLPHDEKLAAEIGELFEVKLNTWGRVFGTPSRDGRGRGVGLTLEGSTPPDIFRGGGGGGGRIVIVTERGRNALEAVARDWIRLTEVVEVRPT